MAPGLRLQAHAVWMVARSACRSQPKPPPTSHMQPESPTLAYAYHEGLSFNRQMGSGVTMSVLISLLKIDCSTTCRGRYRMSLARRCGRFASPWPCSRRAELWPGGRCKYCSGSRCSSRDYRSGSNVTTGSAMLPTMRTQASQWSACTYDGDCPRTGAAPEVVIELAAVDDAVGQRLVQVKNAKSRIQAQEGRRRDGDPTIFALSGEKLEILP